MRRLRQRGAAQLTALAAVCAAAAGAAAWLLLGDTSEQGRPAAAQAPVTNESAAETAKELARSFAVFRTPAHAADRPSRAELDAQTIEDYGLVLTGARRLRAEPAVWAVPGRGVVCLVAHRAGGACTPVASAGSDAQVNLCGFTGSAVNVSALVPDGFSQARLRLRNGRARALAIRRSFVAARVTAGDAGTLPRAVELQGTAGHRSIAVPHLDPADVACARR